MPTRQPPTVLPSTMRPTQPPTKRPTARPTYVPYNSDSYQLAGTVTNNQYWVADNKDSVFWNTPKKVVTQQTTQKMFDYGEKKLIQSFQSFDKQAIVKDVVVKVTTNVVTNALVTRFPVLQPVKGYVVKPIVNFVFTKVANLIPTRWFRSRRSLTDESSFVVGIGFSYNLSIDCTDILLDPEDVMAIANDAMLMAMDSGEYMMEIRAAALEMNSTSFDEAEPAIYEVTSAAQVRFSFYNTVASVFLQYNL